MLIRFCLCLQIQGGLEIEAVPPSEEPFDYVSKAIEKLFNFFIGMDAWGTTHYDS